MAELEPISKTPAAPLGRSDLDCGVARPPNTAKPIPKSLRYWLGAALLAAGACDCDSGPAVPFKHPDQAKQQLVAKETETDAGKADQGPRQGQRLVDAPSQVTVAGATLERADGHIHAVLPRQPDAEQLLVLASDAQGALILERSTRANPKSYLPPSRVLTLQAASPGCSIISGGLDAMSGSHLLATAIRTCDPGEAPGPQPGEARPADDSPGTDGAPTSTGADSQLTHSHFVLSAEDPPRLLERLDLPAPGDGSPPAMTLELHSRRLDKDDHLDLEVALRITDRAASPQDEPIEIALHWHDRPSGLSRAGNEPEAALLSLADRAVARLGQAPEEAQTLARRVVSLHGRLCRGAGAHELVLSGQAGLPCPPSVARARATSVLAAAAVKRGRVLEAIAHRAALDSAHNHVLKVDRKRVVSALKAVPASRRFRFVEGPTLNPVRTTPIHRPRVAFLDEGRILLRGIPNRTYDLATRELAPAGIRSSLLMTDPADRLAATEVFRDCDGYHVRIVRAAQVVNGIVAGRNVSTPLIEKRLSPQSAACSNPAHAMRKDDGGYRVLDYSGAGLLLARGAERLFLPLDAQGQPRVDEARPLSTDLRPLQSDEPMAYARTTGAFPLVTPAGVALVHHGKVELIAPPKLPGPIEDAALSPSGTRLALVQDRRVWIGTTTPHPSSKPRQPDANPATSDTRPQAPGRSPTNVP